MGAWGTGIFENDDAGDWLYELEADGADKVTEAFDAVREGARGGEIEAPDACCALAAAEAVAYAVGTAAEDLTDEQEAAFEKHKAAIAALPGVADKAIAVLDLIVADEETSELLALWSEDGADEDTEAFLETVADVRRRVDG
ncbi:MAG: DUF4259 domain-containing protein [Pseudomonadota bacterium]